MSQHKAALDALFQSMAAGVGAPHAVLRATGTPEDIPQGGALVTIHKGACEQADALLSPLRYEIIWSAAITVDASSDEARDAALDLIAARLLADPNLGGAVDWAEAGAPETEVAAQPSPEGMGQQPPIFAVTFPVRLHYVADSPAG